MESKSHALAAGAFVLVVFGLLIALAAWLMRDDADTVEYEMATFDAVTGLQEQASVRYKGVTVGKVTDITFSQEGEVLVRLAISPETPVTKSTYATLNLQGVTGLSFVQLSDHEEDRSPLAAGPNGVPRIPLHPGLLSIMGDRAEAFAEKASLAVDRINQLLDDGNQTSISEVLSESAAAMRRLNGLLERSDIPALVREGKEAMHSMRGAADQVDKTAGELSLVARDAKTALHTVTAQDGTISRLNSSLTALSTDTLPRITRLADDASHTLRRLDDVAGQLQSNPQALLYGNGPIPPGPGEAGFSAAAPQR